MKKLGKVTENKTRDLLALGKLAEKELAGAVKRYHEERRRLLEDQIRASARAPLEANRDLARKIARFRFKHSTKINEALFSNPKFLPRFIDQHFGGGPTGPFDRRRGDSFGDGIGNPFGDWPGDPKDNPRLGEFVMTIKVLEKYFNIQPPTIDPSMFKKPHILSYPSILSIAEDIEHTITGTLFGASPGSLYITITNTGMRIDPIVLYWSDTAIMLQMPTNVAGVPFHAHGKLTVMNADGYSDNVSVTVEPLDYISTADASYSEAGKKTTAVGPDWWYDYEKTITLKSPRLPQEYKLFNAPSILTAPGVALDIVNNSYVPADLESPASFSLVAGPYESENCLQVKVKITDDWYWDYTLHARFVIIVPKGYSAQGWS